jgi:uncharacterized SAM-binding protein YcdF (DUF218 family)
MKLLIWAGGILLFFACLIFGLGVFLSPDSLANCGAKPSLAKNCAPAAAIVAVSGGNTSQRTAHAIELYQNGWAPKIVFSGANSDPNQVADAEAMRRQAIAAGVPDSAILTDENSKNTRENADNTAKILSDLGASDVILVSSPYHMRRVELSFQNAAPGVNFRTSPADDTAWRLWWISPRGWWLALTETGGIISYYLNLGR